MISPKFLDLRVCTESYALFLQESCSCHLGGHLDFLCKTQKTPFILERMRDRAISAEVSVQRHVQSHLPIFQETDFLFYSIGNYLFC